MLIRGDARFLPLRDGCVDCVVTSPPYFGLRDYGTARWVGGDPACAHDARSGDLRFTHPISDKQRSNAGSAGSAGKECHHCGAQRIDVQIGLEPTADEFVETLVAVFRDVRRVLRDGGTCWLNLGDSYAGSWGAQSRGGPPSAKSTLVGNGHVGGGPKIKSLSTVQIAAHPKRTHTGALSGCYKAKDLMGIPWRVAFALQAAGWYLRSDIIWAKPNPMPESVTDRPTKAHEYMFLLTKSERYWYDADAIREGYAPSTIKEARTGYTGTARKEYAAAGVQDPSETKRRVTVSIRRRVGMVDAYAGDNITGPGANKRSVWVVPTMPYAGAHFATMPEALVEPCILAGCPLGGLVLDPFVGSGTVVSVAQRLGRRGVGVDLSYQDLAKKRTAQRGILFETETGGVR